MSYFGREKDVTHKDLTRRRTTELMTMLYFPSFRVRGMVTVRAALDDFIDWYNDSYLHLNVGKTKEMIVDFRRQGHAHVAKQIHGDPVETVNSYKYLGTIF